MEPIDFEESSRAWRKNKISMGKGHFRYKCAVGNCEEPTYSYITQLKLFHTIATPFDLQHKDHINKYKYCEEHLCIEDC